MHALAALAGIGDPDALAARLALSWDAAREHRLALERGRARISRRGNQQRQLARLALPAITAAACRYIAGMSCALISGLLGADPSTISDATRYARPVLEQHGLAITAGQTPHIHLRDLREHASAAGITIPVPQPAPRTHPQAASEPPAPDTPDPVNLKTNAPLAAVPPTSASRDGPRLVRDAYCLEVSQLCGLSGAPSRPSPRSRVITHPAISATTKRARKISNGQSVALAAQAARKAMLAPPLMTLPTTA